MSPPTHNHLRPTSPADLPALFEFQRDPAGNQLAGTKPRDRAAFDAIWEKILAETPRPGTPSAAAVRVIIADDALVGSINIFPQDDATFIGYWIAREHWGRGIATRAIALLLAEYPARPLTAHVVAHNPASLRALQRNGFIITEREHRPATERYVGTEVITLTLT